MIKQILVPDFMSDLGVNELMLASINGVDVEKTFLIDAVADRSKALLEKAKNCEDEEEKEDNLDEARFGYALLHILYGEDIEKAVKAGEKQIKENLQKE